MNDGLGCLVVVILLVICLLVFIAGCLYKIAFPAEYHKTVRTIDVWFTTMPHEVWWFIGVGCLLWVIYKPRR